MASNFDRLVEKTFKFFASIQLAIFILVGLGIMSAAGTILESRYDTAYAQKVIYHSPFMYFLLGLLCVNLLNVMIDRWPWKPHHTGFILAHVGIILLVVGSLVTRLFGIDGTMAFDIGQKNRFISVNEPELAIYSSYGDGPFKMLFSTTRDFFIKVPTRENPYEITAGQEKFSVINYQNYSLRESKVVESSDPKSGPAVRIQLQNDRVNVTQWIIKAKNMPFAEMNLGPAKIVLAEHDTPYLYEGGNIILIRTLTDAELSYEIFTASRREQTIKGKLPLAEPIQTGWMGLQMRVFKYIPHAEEKITFTERQYPTGQTRQALKILHRGQEHWLGMNSTLKLFHENQAYVLVYRNRMIDLGYDILLDHFEVGRYEGSRQAKSYESIVSVPELGSVKISMNEPLKHKGFTFYQASFEENEMGEPTSSILSVNKDPGRFIKYLGSLMMVLGTIVMFYFKKYRLAILGQKKSS